MKTGIMSQGSDGPMLNVTAAVIMTLCTLILTQAGVSAFPWDILTQAGECPTVILLPITIMAGVTAIILHTIHGIRIIIPITIIILHIIIPMRIITGMPIIRIVITDMVIEAPGVQTAAILRNVVMP